ncbi:MAG: metal ABC transporter substrate-binding protein [Myxococcaceae bacterium]|nr:metal ABC transporter substrate-binding protein [Myxococcaceae bacterium]
MNRCLSQLLLSFMLVMPWWARAEAPLKVVTTIETLADLTRQVGGEQVTVQSLGKGYQDPHFVEAKPNLMVALNQADLLVRVGMDLEVGWLPPLVLGARNTRLSAGQDGDLDCSRLIEPLDVPSTKVDRAQGDIHPMGNPHYWLPPINAVRIAKGISERLTQLRPSAKDYFAGRFKAFVAQLKTRAVKWEQLAKPFAGTQVVTYHQSFSYVSKWLQLEERGYVENKPGVPPSPKHLAELIGQMRSDGVKLLLVESYYNRSIADDVAEKGGAKVVSVATDVGAKPAIKSYFDLVDALFAALGQAAPAP